MFPVFCPVWESLIQPGFLIVKELNLASRNTATSEAEASGEVELTLDLSFMAQVLLFFCDTRSRLAVWVVWRRRIFLGRILFLLFIYSALLLLHCRFHGEGYREGYEEGSSLGMIEGRQHGTLHGAKVGSEVSGTPCLRHLESSPVLLLLTVYLDGQYDQATVSGLLKWQ